MGDISSISVKIPKELYEKIEEKISGTSFASVEEYIVSKLENEFPTEPVYTKEEEDLIRERLRRLGYIE
jgi:Arc/MetJ-type ribon-helix-helix transcriptional regulator